MRIDPLAIIIVSAIAGSGLAPVSAQTDAPGSGLDVGDAGDVGRYPAPDSGYVTDLAGLLSSEAESRLEQWLWTAEAESGVEIAVVTIGSIRDFPGTDNASIESFARGLFDAYGIGNMPNNDGILLLIARADRKARIELGAGYGNLRNGDAMRIMDRVIIPRFKKNRYENGIVNGVAALINEFTPLRVGANWPLILIPLLIAVLLPISISLFRHGKRGWGWVVVGLIIVLVLALLSTVYHVTRFVGRATDDVGGAGGFGGGFGGGFSGGGGATGSW